MPSVDQKNLLNSLQTGVIVCDANLNVHLLNHAAEQMFSVSERVCVGRVLDSILNLPIQFIARCQEAYSGLQSFNEHEVVLQNSVGEAFVANILASFTFWEDEPLLLLELSLLDRHMRIVREGAQQAQYQASRLLLKGLAHEIKNPLGGLRGAAQLLEAELGGHSELAEYTQVIMSEADRLQGLIDRMAGPNQLPQRKPLNIHEVTEWVAGLLEAQKKPDIAVVRDYDPSIPECLADRDWLVQALLNIGINALNAVGDHGSVTLKTRVVHNYTIGSVRHRLCLVMQVLDDGPGVPVDLQATLFYPLVTGRAQGTGLGLSIAQSIVARHGGALEYDTGSGGSTFSIYLPLGDAQDG